MRVEPGHVSVAGLAQAVAFLRRQRAPWQGEVGEDPHGGRLGLLASSTKMLVVEISDLCRQNKMLHSFLVMQNRILRNLIAILHVRT